MIRSYHLTKGGVVATDDAASLPKGKGLVWLHCLKPQEEDLRALERLAAIPYENLSVALDEEIHPYIEKEGHLELVYRAPVLEDGDIVTEPLIIFLTGRVVVTLARERLRVIHDLKRRLAANRSGHLLAGRAAAFAANLVDEINDDFLKRIEKVTQTIDLFEEQEVRDRNFRILYDASLTSAHFNQALIGNVEVLNMLRKLRHKDLREEDRESFHDLYLEGRQLLDTEKIQRELITNLFTLQNLLANQQVERKLQRLTVLAIVIAVPTMISGLYGMNVAGLPLATHPQAFWLLLGAMLAAILLLALLFKGLDWL